MNAYEISFIFNNGFFSFREGTEICEANNEEEAIKNLIRLPHYNEITKIRNIKLLTDEEYKQVLQYRERQNLLIEKQKSWNDILRSSYIKQ